MTLSEKQNYFSTIQERLEAGNAVTFKWLSRKCKIHCTASKRLLTEFINDSVANEYAVTYLVFGKNQNGDLVIKLSDGLEKNHDNDIAIIDKQIYSVERSSSSITADEFYCNDKLSFQMEQMNLSSINYPTKIIKKPNLRQLCNRKTNDEKLVKEEKSTENPSTSTTEVKSKNTNVKEVGLTLMSKSKAEEKIQNNTDFKSPGKSFFKRETEPKINTPKTSKNSVAGKGSLPSLFQNHRVKNNPASGNGISNKNTNIKTNLEGVDSKKEDDTVETIKLKHTEELLSMRKVTSVGNERKKKTTKKNSTKSKKKPDKKLKRITTAFQSSDESASDSEISETESLTDQIAEEPELEREFEKAVDSESDTVAVKGRKRKRKVIVNNSSLGDDGYFYTEKEVVYESCDSGDNDENDPTVNDESSKRLKPNETGINPKTVVKTETSSPYSEKCIKNQKGKTKQASIMNFFKKS